MNETTPALPLTASGIMNAPSGQNGTAQVTITLTVPELEQLLRRVIAETVREVVGEELAKARLEKPCTVVDDWSQEGPDDPEQDQKALAEAIETWEKYKDDLGALTNWEEFDVAQDQIDHDNI